MPTTNEPQAVCLAQVFTHWHVRSEDEPIGIVRCASCQKFVCGGCVAILTSGGAQGEEAVS